jgi:hypothetical protein
LPPESWTIVDDFKGTGKHKFAFHYHFAPDLELSSLEQDENGVLIQAARVGLQLRLFASLPVLSAQVVRGDPERLGGWAAPGYGRKQACSTLLTTIAGEVPAAAMTFLVPAAGGAHGSVVRRLIMTSGSGIAYAYAHDGCEDMVAMSTGDSDMAVAGFEMRGEFFWLRLRGGALKHVMAVRARSLHRDGEPIFQRSEPSSYSGSFDAPRTSEGVSNPVQPARAGRASIL